MKISDNTNIGLPLRNLLMLVSSIVVGAWFAFGVIERLNRLETKNQLFEKDLLEASVQKPIDQEQFMILEWQATQIEKMQKQLEAQCTYRCDVV
jgi:hypothetical protein